MAPLGLAQSSGRAKSQLICRGRGQNLRLGTREDRLRAGTRSPKCDSTKSSLQASPHVNQRQNGQSERKEEAHAVQKKLPWALANKANHGRHKRLSGRLVQTQHGRYPRSTGAVRSSEKWRVRLVKGQRLNGVLGSGEQLPWSALGRANLFGPL